ncbi:MAG: efflux RND transporter periplasmic adaptor subunit [Deltaproteobacteria bacterium]|nr:efflux RND transporter periplasmic adaptor subunit [Deltaproteobacteria bacterium]
MAGGAVFFGLQTIEKQKHKSNSSEVTGHDQAAVPVTVSAVVRREFQDKISAVGTLKARETGLLSPKVAGNVEAVLVDIGEKVQTDQVVIRIDRTNFELAVNRASAALATAKSAVSLATVRLQHADKEFRRASSLLAEKVIPQGRFDKAEAAYKAARQALATAKDQRNQAEVAVQTAMQHLKDTQIRSPISGVVVERNVEIGQSVAPGAPLLRILDQSTLKADIDLPESDFARIAAGTPAVIQVDAFQGQLFPGKVVLVNPMVDRKTRTFRVRIESPNPTAKLVDGMFVRVQLSAAQRTALAVERDALNRLPGSGTFYVFVVDEDKAVKRTVKTGVVGDQYAEVLEGLSEGEKVVTSGAGRLRSGVRVNIQADRHKL